jgi:hypothetical protein
LLNETATWPIVHLNEHSSEDEDADEVSVDSAATADEEDEEDEEEEADDDDITTQFSGLVAVKAKITLGDWTAELGN